jgi:hypothetical protein
MTKAVTSLQTTLAVKTAKRGKVTAVSAGLVTVSTDTGESVTLSAGWSAKPGDAVLISGGAAVKVPATENVFVVEV